MLLEAPVVFFFGFAFPCEATDDAKSAKRVVAFSGVQLIPYTGVPEAAIAAAAWSCVEKMLHDDQVTSAPRDVSVSIKTAVCIAECQSRSV